MLEIIGNVALGIAMILGSIWALIWIVFGLLILLVLGCVAYTIFKS